MNYTKLRANKHDRKSVHSIEDVYESLKDVIFLMKKQDSRVLFHGDIIKGNSQRYQTFFTSGTKCVCCGLEGTYFAKEKCSGNDNSYHLNLYGIDGGGNEVLFTKDHIIPKSKGGENKVTNYQTMCSICNEEKGNKVEG